MTTSATLDRLVRTEPSVPDTRALVADLLVLYADEIRDAATRFTRTAADADDLAQDVMVRALDFAHHFERGTNFPAWIRTMTRNLAINRTKRDRLRPVAATSLAPTADAADAVIESAPARETMRGPSDLRELLACREDLSGPVLAAVERLPERYRQILLLWALGECEYREIARIAGCPVGTVMSRLHRARRLMRRWLAESVASGEVR